MKSSASTSAALGFEDKLWAAADVLRNNMDPAEYKHVVPGLIFVKYISDAFEERQRELVRSLSEPGSAHFVEATNPLFARITANARESSTLAALRNTLLPQLLSGEVGVP